MDTRKDLSNIDIEQIEEIQESHLGKTHTKLVMKNGEVVTVSLSTGEVVDAIMKAGNA